MIYQTNGKDCYMEQCPLRTNDTSSATYCGTMDCIHRKALPGGLNCGPAIVVDEKDALPPPGKYRHYKGGVYEVIDIACHSETLEKMVVYRALYDERRLWVRPASMWNEIVENEGYCGPRFVRIVD